MRAAARGEPGTQGQNERYRTVRRLDRGTTRCARVLDADRLRATYIVALLDEGASLTELMAWTGLKGCDALEPYLRFVKVDESSCSFAGRS